MVKVDHAQEFAELLEGPGLREVLDGVDSVFQGSEAVDVHLEAQEGYRGGPEGGLVGVDNQAVLR